MGNTLTIRYDSRCHSPCGGNMYRVDGLGGAMNRTGLENRIDWLISEDGPFQLFLADMVADMPLLRRVAHSWLTCDEIRVLAAEEGLDLRTIWAWQVLVAIAQGQRCGQ